MADECADEDQQHDLKRCKACLTDPDKRVVEAEQFGSMKTPADYAAVLRHYIEEHTDSDELNEVVDDLSLSTPCAECHEPFVSSVHVVESGLTVRSFCDDCAADDQVIALIYRSVDLEEVLPQITEETEDQETNAM